MRVYWLQQAQRDLPADDDWLTAGESVRLSALGVPKRRADWRLGRWTAKRAVIAYLENQRVWPHSCTANLRDQDIEIRPTRSGAPDVFLRGDPAALTISLTHSNGVAVCAVAPLGAALGCDLELIEPRSPEFVADYFTGEEQALVAHAPPVRDRVITLLWSAKESALKAQRTGLRVDTRDLNVTPSLRAGDGWHSLSVRFSSGETFDGWWREHSGFILTVASVPSPAPPIALDVASCLAHTPA